METVETPEIKPIQTSKPKTIKFLGFRTNMPVIVRAGAAAVIAVTLLGIIVGVYLQKRKPDFHLISDLPQLSKDVTGVVTNYERRETDGDVIKYYVKADKATTFNDNHQELEGAFIQVYDERGEQFDQIQSEKAIYIPNPNDSKLFEAHFVGNVNIETRDNLKVKSDALSYNRETEIAKSEQLVEFERNNISGKSFGAFVKIKEKRLELLRDVEINAIAGAGDELAKANLHTVKLKSGSAVVLQNEGLIELNSNVVINLEPDGKGSLQQPTDIKGDFATARFDDKDLKSVDLRGNVEIYVKPVGGKYTRATAERATAIIENGLKRAEFENNVFIETTENNSQPTKIKTRKAVYFKSEEKFELTNNVEITTVEGDKPTLITSQNAVYRQAEGLVDLNGGAKITQGEDFLQGETISAKLSGENKIQNAVSRGNAYLKQIAANGFTEISSNEINANFDNAQNIQTANVVGNARLRQSNSERLTEVSANQIAAIFNSSRQIEKANITGNANAAIIPVSQQQYSKVEFSAVRAIELLFRAGQNDSNLSQINTDGRTTIVMNAPANNPKASNKKLVADSVKTTLNANGRDLANAEAVGNAELFIEPLQSASGNYKTTITAARFDCDFYETGNNPKICTAKNNAKAVMLPTVQAANNGARNLTADVITSNFNRENADVQQIEAAGNAKFSELDRNGIAERFIYTSSDEVVRLRGGEPTVWDSRARAKAGEIDWDTAQQKSALRGKVSTTYYSQKQTNGAAPFGKTNAPVYLTADNAQFDHKREVAVYTGNARAWQDNNFVRADELILQQKDRRLDGSGKVQSLIYNIARRENGKKTNQPVFASADKIAYSDQKKLLQYNGNVDIRQAGDRITAGSADILIDEENDLRQTIAENNVVITQPNRRVTGTWAQYTVADETVILRGNPATVEDAAQGSTQGSQLTVALRENKITNQGATKTSGGRTRTVYRIKTN